MESLMAIDLRAGTWRDTTIELLAIPAGSSGFTGLRDRSRLLALAHRLMTIRPDCSADGVGVTASAPSTPDVGTRNGAELAGHARLEYSQPTDDDKRDALRHLTVDR
jgi:hypothetical protein